MSRPYAKQCRYECGSQIIWNDKISKFIEVATDEIHTQDRCKLIKSGDLRLPAIQDKKQRAPAQQEGTLVKTTSQSLESAAIIGKLDNLATQIQMIGDALFRIIESDADKSERMQLLQKIAELEQIIKQDPKLVQKASELTEAHVQEMVNKGKTEEEFEV